LNKSGTDAAKLWVGSTVSMKNWLKLFGGYVYIMCNKNRTTLYTGVSSDLISRVQQHKDKYYPKSFTARYNCNQLVYYFFFATIEEAIVKEKLIKGGSRAAKIQLIEHLNPEWKDLHGELF
jgi:putative endonuclease